MCNNLNTFRMNKELVVEIAKKYLIKKDKDDPLYVQVPKYNLFNRVKLFFLYLYYRMQNISFYEETYAKPVSYDTILMVRTLLEESLYESEYFWIVFYDTNLFLKKKHPRFWLSPGEGCAFAIDKETSLIYIIGYLPAIDCETKEIDKEYFKGELKNFKWAKKGINISAE